MIDRRDRTGLAPEAIEHLVTRGQFGGQHLDRDIAIEARVVGSVHLAHSPLPDRIEDSIDAEVATGRENHMVGQL